MSPAAMSSPQALQALWQLAALPDGALGSISLTGPPAVVPSGFAVTTAVQASLGAAALAAAEVWHRRQADGARQQVSIDSTHAVLDSQAWFSIDGQTPNIWEKFSGLYPCGGQAHPGWVRIHANFDHHRDGALRLLDLPTDGSAERADVARALASWRAEDFETAAAEAGLVVSALRSFEQWHAHAQARALREQPVLRLTRLDDGAPALPWAPMNPDHRPLTGVRVLDLTRILAGPVAACTLAAYGAEVLMVNSPQLPNISAMAGLSRGKRSCLLDLDLPADAATLHQLVQGAQVFLQGYRPGGLGGRGFSAQALARLRPGIVCASLTAYGDQGPWAMRRGFDSLVQTATGFNHDEAAAFGQTEPRALPFQALDYSAGYLLAFGIQAALLRQASEGGSWQVQVSLAGVGQWLRGLGRPGWPEGGMAAKRPDIQPFVEQADSGWGRLSAVRHAAQFSRTPAGWDRPSVKPGTDAASWPG